jgi:uncharacterized protein
MRSSCISAAESTDGFCTLVTVRAWICHTFAGRLGPERGWWERQPPTRAGTFWRVAAPVEPSRQVLERQSDFAAAGLDSAPIVPDSKVEVQESPIHCQGVFATRAYRRGERVLAIDDSRVVTDDTPLDPQKGEFEHHQDYLGNHVVLMQEPERYINHCCEPNAYVKTLDGVRWVIAYRDISPGDEITYDYCINSYGDEQWECHCGHPKCRKVHHTDFFNLPDAKVREYLPLLDDWYVRLAGDRVEAARQRLGSLR